METSLGLQLTTSMALIVVTFCGVLAGKGHTFTPVATAVISAALLAWKESITGFATVGTIVGLVASGASFEEILQLYPYLESEDIRAAVAYAAWRSEERETPLRTA
jgi:uncharacterized membrane protein (DUF4010 family)